MAQSCVIPGGVPVILGGAITIDSYMIPMNIFASVSSSEKVHQSINQSNCIMSALTTEVSSRFPPTGTRNTILQPIWQTYTLAVLAVGGSNREKKNERRQCWLFVITCSSAITPKSMAVVQNIFCFLKALIIFHIVTGLRALICAYKPLSQ